MEVGGVVEDFEGKTEGGDKGFGGVGGFGVEDLEGEEGVVEWGEREGETLILDRGGASPTRLLGLDLSTLMEEDAITPLL
ncbi:hypothetical protein RJT34_17431 [Clitoria ternatea]|uniref:Uncharacterized protein n=1 Tax=Clitoria ternatea TaxID=43366 RepID=A0AAN9PEU7_CLITE